MVKSFLQWLGEMRIAYHARRYTAQQRRAAGRANKEYMEGQIETQRNLMLEQYVIKSHEKGTFDPDLYDDLEKTKRP